MTEFETINPVSLNDALSFVAKKGVVPIAGGTDLLVILHDRYHQPWPTLLVLDRIKALHKIKIGNKSITLGPLVTFSKIEKSEELALNAPQLVQGALVAGSVQIRNRATIGGNIANGSPSGDLLPSLYVLEAKLELSSKTGKRLVSIEKFFKGPRSTILKKNELITAIEFSKSSNFGFFLRLATRKALAISKVSVAVDTSIRDGVIESIKIALGAVAPTVIRASATEEFLAGKKIDKTTIVKAIQIIKSEATPIDDIRSLADYRREMVGVLFKRGFNTRFKFE